MTIQVNDGALEALVEKTRKKLYDSPSKVDFTKVAIRHYVEHLLKTKAIKP